MTQCSVPGCKNESGKKYGRKISYHKFPVNSEQRRKWLKAINKPTYEPSAYAVVCSDHFQNNYYETVGFKTMLLPNAIPICNLKEQESIIDEPLPTDSEPTASTSKEVQVILEKKIFVNDKKLDNELHFEEEISDEEELSFLASEAVLSYSPLTTRTDSRQTASSESSIISFETLRTQKLRNNLTVARRKIKMLQQKNLRQSRRINALRSMVKHLRKRNLLNTNVDILSNLNITTKELVCHQIPKEQAKMKSSSALKNFELTLKFYAQNAPTGYIVGSF